MALRGDEPEFMNLREWDRRARLIRDKQTSRRFSASYVGSFREDHHKPSSTRTNFNSISSTASSPGYTLKGAYNFTTLFLYLSIIMNYIFWKCSKFYLQKRLIHQHIPSPMHSRVSFFHDKNKLNKGGMFNFVSYFFLACSVTSKGNVQ